MFRWVRGVSCAAFAIAIAGCGSGGSTPHGGTGGIVLPTDGTGGAFGTGTGGAFGTGTGGAFGSGTGGVFASGTGGAFASGTGGAGGMTPLHQQTGASWTILVYMAADNNLEPAALDDLVEMATAGSGNSASMRIVVEVDRSPDYVVAPAVNLPDFSGAKRILVGPNRLDVVQDLGAIDSGSGDSLASFITWGMTNYPADRTALVLWDHGGGWDGFGVDESTNHMISLPALRTAIQQGLAGAGASRLALVGFDACLMATFEVATMLRPYAEYLLASEETIPGHGWDYAAFSAAANNPSIAPVPLARKLVDGYVAQSTAERDQQTVTLSLIDLYALGDLEAGLGALATANGMPLPAAKATAIGRARVAAQEFGRVGQRPGVMVDVVDLANTLAAADASYATPAASIAAGVTKAVLYAYHGAAEPGANGISVYFPMQSRDEDPTYEQIMELGPWRAFLDAYFGITTTGNVGAPLFVNDQGDANVELKNGEMIVSGQLTPGSAAVISKATLYFGLVDVSTSTVYILGDQTATVDDPLVQAAWNMGILRLDQGTASAYAYLSIEATPGGGGTIVVPFNYRVAPGAAPQSATFIQDSLYVQTADALGALIPEPGSTLTSLILVSESSGLVWQETVAALDPTTDISVGFEPIPSGSTTFVQLIVANIKGQTSYVFAAPQIP
jgi:hypothetical protein